MEAKLQGEDAEDPVREESPIDRGQYREISEDNLLEVSRQIGVEAGVKGGYAGVTASVKTKFKRSEERSEKTHFLKKTYACASGDSNML